MTDQCVFKRKRKNFFANLIATRECYKHVFVILCHVLTFPSNYLPSSFRFQYIIFSIDFPLSILSKLVWKCVYISLLPLLPKLNHKKYVRILFNGHILFDNFTAFKTFLNSNFGILCSFSFNVSNYLLFISITTQNVEAFEMMNWI